MAETTDGAADRLEELFAAALEHPAGERELFLDRACGADETLRRELAELLAAHEEAGTYLDDLSDAIGSAAGSELETAARPRLRIGPYRALSVLGHGGMGAVYLAVRADGAFDQRVALKLLHLDMETPEIRARFLAERQLLAQLSHPHIAKLLDGGVTEEGRPFFAMEYVEGVPLTVYCRDHGLPVEARLRLVLEVIEAVSYLHRNLIVHRDLKPSNVLVDTAGRVKLLDFGIAKLLAGDRAAGRTRTGERLLTPHYAAPEQLKGDPVTTATDVYALGVVLYELLTGERPHQRDVLDLGALERESTQPPSTRRKGISRDLDLLCLKALRPEPPRRYASAEQLGQDIERYLEGLPIAARPSTWSYRLGRFVRRNRGGVVAAAALATLLATGFVGERRLRSQAEAARGRAEEEAAKAVAVSDFLADLLSSVDPARAQGKDVAVADVLAGAAERLDADTSAFADLPAVEAALRLTIGRTYTALGRPEEALIHLRRAVELSGGLEARTPEALEAAAALGVALFRAVDYEAAEPILRRVLEVRTAVLGEEHPDTLRSLGELADLYWYERRFDEVEPLDRRTLRVRRRVLGEEHPETLRAVNGLATTLYSLGRYEEAGRLFAEALAGQERTLGPDHPETLRLVNNLGATLTEIGRFEEAEALGRRAVEGRRRVLGETNGNTATALHNLALTLLGLGRIEEAEGVLQEAIDIRATSPSLSGYWYSVSFMADLRAAQGRREEAEELYRRSIEGLSEVDGVEDATTLRARSRLAALRLAQGRLDEAEAGLEPVLATQARVLGADHPETLDSRLTLARLRRAQGRLEDATYLAREVHDAGVARRGAEHPGTREAAELLRELEGGG